MIKRVMIPAVVPYLIGCAIPDNPMSIIQLRELEVDPFRWDQWIKFKMSNRTPKPEQTKPRATP